MALADLFRKLADDMLRVGGLFQDVPVQATYISLQEGNATTYDPVAQTSQENTTEYAIEGVKDLISYQMIDNVNVFPKDQLFMVSQATFARSGLPIKNKPGDRLVIGTERFLVMQITTDPVTAFYMIQLRNP